MNDGCKGCNAVNLEVKDPEASHPYGQAWNGNYCPRCAELLAKFMVALLPGSGKLEDLVGYAALVVVAYNRECGLWQVGK